MDSLIIAFNNLSLWVCALSTGGFYLLIDFDKHVFQLRVGQPAKGLFLYVCVCFFF